MASDDESIRFLRPRFKYELLDKNVFILMLDLGCGFLIYESRIFDVKLRAIRWHKFLHKKSKSWYCQRIDFLKSRNQLPDLKKKIQFVWIANTHGVYFITKNSY